MKKILLIWLAPIFLYAQFTDDFTTFEGWLGDTAEFSIESRFYFDRIDAK
ncbi:MAG: hypothetical protein P8N00_01890 [Flavobacteriales bacterium]|nr:hypothetical protein [Flavobacteriales bacterium]